MFEIKREPFGKFEQVKIVNTRTQEYVAIIPEFGATINGLSLNKNNQNFEVIDNCHDYPDLIKEGKEKFKGSKLFPFPNRIKDGEYQFSGTAYNLKKNHPSEGHAIHGLVLEKKFDICFEEEGENEGLMELIYQCNGNDEGYPFKYLLKLFFSLSAEGFKCKTEIENIDDKNIPVSDGWHPYFKTGTKIDELFIKIPSTLSIAVDERMIPTGKFLENKKFLKSENITDEKFDTCFKISDEEGTATIELIDKKKNLKLIVWQETGKNKYNFVQIYTPPSRECIAIEPMTSMPDAFNNKNGLIILEPNKKMNFTFGVKIE
jgi:aldose 1-epimerase